MIRQWKLLVKCYQSTSILVSVGRPCRRSISFHHVYVLISSEFPQALARARSNTCLVVGFLILSCWIFACSFLSVRVPNSLLYHVHRCALFYPCLDLWLARRLMNKCVKNRLRYWVVFGSFLVAEFVGDICISWY
jgi:hypothetical protein